MKWNELIEKVMDENDGIASIQHLYSNASKFKELPSGDWQKTLRGVLYREVNKGNFKKIGLSVYALPDYKEKSSAFKEALANKNASEYLKNAKDRHSVLEGMLIEIGNYFEYVTYTCDKNKVFDGKVLGSICHLKEIPEFTYEELKNTAAKSDVIWFSKSKLPFPKVVFEVESTTDFTNSMLKMFQLIHYDANFVLIAYKQKESTFLDRLSKEPFEKVKNKFSFRSFEDVANLYFTAAQHYELKSNFLNFG